MRLLLLVLLLVSRAATAAPFEPTAFKAEIVHAGKGSPILYIPGVACPGSVFADAVAHFANHEAHLITLAGFAGVPRIDDPAPLAAAVAQLALYIEDRKLDHPIVIGHSLGGFVAYWLAADAPSLVGPVISIDMSPALDGGQQEADTLRARWYNATDKQHAQLLSAKFFAMTRQAKRMATALVEIKKSDRRAIGDSVSEMVLTDLRPKLPSITAPVLSIVASGSGQHRIKKHTKVIAHHKFVVVPASTHFLWWDTPRPFYAAVDAFLASPP